MGTDNSSIINVTVICNYFWVKLNTVLSRLALTSHKENADVLLLHTLYVGLKKAYEAAAQAWSWLEQFVVYPDRGPEKITGMYIDKVL